MNMIGHERLKTPVIGGDYVLQGIVRLARRMFWENERSIVLSRVLPNLKAIISD